MRSPRFEVEKRSVGHVRSERPCLPPDLPTEPRRTGQTYTARPYTDEVTGLQLIAMWGAIGVTAVVAAVGWAVAAKANRELKRTRRLLRRVARMATDAHQTASTALRKADEASREQKAAS